MKLKSIFIKNDSSIESIASYYQEYKKYADMIETLSTQLGRFKAIYELGHVGKEGRLFFRFAFDVGNKILNRFQDAFVKKYSGMWGESSNGSMEIKQEE